MPMIELEVKTVGSDATWTEKYDCKGDPGRWAADLVSRFNAALRPGERPRELVAVRVLEDAPPAPDHIWRKENLTTIIDQVGPSYDVYRCERCGITGKRFGVGEGIRRDLRYGAKKYEKCQA